jgi:anti-sigma factor RsiW
LKERPIRKRLIEMAAYHPETELVPYLRGGLSAEERSQVERHLEQCSQCRQSMESAGAMLSRIAHAVDEVRAPDWTQYRIELRRKMRAVEAGRVNGARRWRLAGFGWPSIAMSAAAAAILGIAIIMHHGGGLPAPGVDQLQMPQEMSDADVGLLANYRVVEHLDLLENYDVIEHLDELAPGDRRNHETSS